ncbi:hypothetical protein PN836_020520 [Ningiella sp. W23]|uniref:hypothetical protein n=1 Tax=Ningiella sp. W23 TaxID=3023715 RepID=UPI0037575CD5
MSNLIKVIITVTCAAALSACELLHIPGPQTPVNDAPVEDANATYLCKTADTLEKFNDYCQLDRWSEFLLNVDGISWVERREIIKTLSEAPADRLQKVLLSQAEDTPYANRLRAQNWIRALKPVMDEQMQKVITVMVEQPSQQLLELESAITILSRVNTRQEKTISELQETLEARREELETQRDQVEQLLQIEANMSDEKRGN